MVAAGCGADLPLRLPRERKPDLPLHEQDGTTNTARMHARPSRFLAQFSRYKITICFDFSEMLARSKSDFLRSFCSKFNLKSLQS